MKVSVLAAVASCILLTVGFADPADASIRKTTSIPAEPLSEALRTLAKDRQFEILYRAEVVRDMRTEGAIGEFTPEEALKQLLTGTGLSYKYLDANTVTVFPQVPTQASTSGQSSNPTSDAAGESSTNGGGKKSSQDFRVAQVDKTPAGSSTVANAAQSPTNNLSGGPALTEIIVTAQKREERLQDVPVPVTAISAQTLLNTHELRLQDYFNRIPGLTVTSDDTDGGGPNLSIRGISTGPYTNPTVGVTVDDIPFGSSTVLGGGAQAPDIDPSDLARVEVLRGPQGTLYGVSSIGGLLKFVTLDPSTDEVSGHVQGDLNRVYNGEDTGFGVRAGVNVPITSTLAIRASVFVRDDPGYIDNIESGQSDINWTTAEGGRLSALWKASDEASVKISALLQDTKTHGSSVVTTGLGDLQQNTARGAEGQERKLQAYSVTFKDKIGGVHLTSLTGYNTTTLNGAVDISDQIGSVTQQQFGVTGTPIEQSGQSKKFSQEIRLSGELGQHFEWLLGGFYTHESSAFDGVILAVNPVTGEIKGTWLNEDLFPTTYKEYAAFTDLTFLVTDRFDIQIGGRESENHQTYMETIVGIFDPILLGLTSPVINPQVDTKGNSFTYLVTPRFKLSPDVMVYARLASGYRAGGPNPTSTVFGLPSSFKPDTTENYDLGFKGEFLDHKISIDTSLYYIDWKDIQLQLVAACGCAQYYTNASRAKSQGLEISVEARPSTGWTIATWIAISDAALTQGFPADSIAYGAPGDRLPYASRFTGSSSVDREFEIASRVQGFIGGSINYVGAREGVFTASPERQVFGGYARTDLRAGIKRDLWTLSAFVNNVTDKRGALSGGVGSYYPNGITYIQPRTAGLSVSRTF
jgi:iron complex outermembrane receptor protein